MDCAKSKQLRPDKISGTSTDLGSNHETYFDMLSPDELTAILRKMSLRPRSPKWKAFETPSDILSILRTEDALSSVAHSVFSGLTYSHYRGNDTDHFLHCASDEQEQIFGELLSQLRSSLESLKIETYLIVRIPDAVMCSHLHTLKISNTDSTDFFSILPSISRRLRVLHIGGFSRRGQILALSEHCVGLTELSLLYRFVACTLQALWETLGPTLTELSIAQLYIATPKQIDSLLYEFNDMQCQSDIAENCKLITHFRIFNCLVSGR